MTYATYDCTPRGGWRVSAMAHHRRVDERAGHRSRHHAVRVAAGSAGQDSIEIMRQLSQVRGSKVVSSTSMASAEWHIVDALTDAMMPMVAISGGTSAVFEAHAVRLASQGLTSTSYAAPRASGRIAANATLARSGHAC